MLTATSLLQSAAENIFFYVVTFLLTIAFVVIVHEFGHFLVARFFKVRIEQFAFGFGKELIGFGGKNNKTRWSLCLFPIGGYVKIFGDVDKENPVIWDKEKEEQRQLTPDELEIAFCTKPVWQRMLIVFAGPAINLLLTLGIFILLFSLHGERSKSLVINSLSVGSPAKEAGMQLGDHFLEMDGEPIRRLEDIYDKTWYEIPPVEHTYTIKRGDQTQTISFSARHIEYRDKKRGIHHSHGQTGMLQLKGIEFTEIEWVEGISTKNDPQKSREIILKNMDKEITIGMPFKAGPDLEDEKYIIFIPSELNQHLNNPDHEHYKRLFLMDPDDRYYLRLGIAEATTRSLTLMKDILVDSYKVLAAIYRGTADDRVVVGVGKMSQHTAKAAKAGFYDFMVFVAALSYMIAVINLLPIPVLDGGYLVFLTYEALTGKAVSERIQNVFIIIGLIILGGIMIFANISDLISLLTAIESR